MGSAVSVDNSKNVTDTLNKSTLEQVKERNLSCASQVEQIQQNDLDYINTSNPNGGKGGDISISQFAGLASNCVLTSSDQEALITAIAADVAQKIKTDKGAAAAFSLVSVNDQENTNKINQELSQKYSDVSNLKCDLTLYCCRVNSESDFVFRLWR